MAIRIKKELFNARRERLLMCDYIYARERLLPAPKGSAFRQVLIHALDASAPIHLVRAHPAGQKHIVLCARRRG